MPRGRPSLVFSDPLYDAQLGRAIGYAPHGGAEVGECLAVARRVGRADADRWYAEWLALADQLHTQGADSAARGQRVDARYAYLRAANYARTAGIFLLRAPVDDRLHASRRLEVEAFRAAATLLDRPVETVGIPFGELTLPGYFFSAGDGPRPTVLLTGGYDGTVEELYFANAAAAIAHGYHALAFDGPGQGSVILDQGIPFRPDWEVVVRSVVDFALARPDVDGARLALIGLSFGGYLAPRAATAEHRLAACVSDCGPYDLYAASVARLPRFLARQLDPGHPRGRAAVGRLLDAVASRPSAGWSMRRNQLVHGVADPLAFFDLAKEFSLRGREAEIRCPTLVTSAEGDVLSDQAEDLYAALTCPKRFIRFRAADGAGQHCEALARGRFHREAFDWLDGVLSSGAA